ncbi:MAG: site-2 protease family protein, partial [Lachnospiraceae bacterium]
MNLLKAGGKLKILLALLIFCVIVISHELGHFLIAKANGIAVTEFCIGFGPTLFGFTRNGTKYSIKPIPLGGACIFDDEDPENLAESSFLKANVWARIATIAAGPIFNFILAFILALFVIGSTGYPTTELESVAEGGAAEAAGIQEGDVILKMDNERVYLYPEVILNTQFSTGETVSFTYERDGEKHVADITPKYSEADGRYLYGFAFGAYTGSRTPVKTLEYSYYYVRYQIKMTLKSLQMLVTGRVS